MRLINFILINFLIQGHGSVPISRERVTSSAHTKLIVLSYDGFRYDYLNKTRTPNMDWLISQGVYVSELTPQFTTKTFPNHQTMATGLFVESHGIVGNDIFDPVHKRYLPGYGEGSDQFWDFSEDVLPLWTLNELAGEGRVSGAQWPGSDKPYGKAKTLPTHYLSVDLSRLFESRVDYIVNWLTDRDKPANLAFMHFEQPDFKGHDFGPNSPEVESEIGRMDGITGYLIERLKTKGIFEQVNIIILSDHGMEEVTLRRVINLTDIVHPSLYRRYGKSPVLQILPEEGKLEEVYEAFKTTANFKRNFKVYKKEEIPESWHYKNNVRVLPILVVAEPGYVFEDFVTDLEKQLLFHANTDYLDPDKIHGVHGYNRNLKNMKAMAIAFGPAFKQGYVQKVPIDNVHLFPLMCEIVGIEPPSNNGSLDKVKEFLHEDFKANIASLHLLTREFYMLTAYTVLTNIRLK